MSQVSENFNNSFDFPAEDLGEFASTSGEQNLSSNNEGSGEQTAENIVSDVVHTTDFAQSTLENNNAEQSMAQAPEAVGAVQQTTQQSTQQPGVGQPQDVSDEEALRQKIVELTTELTQIKNSQLTQAPPVPAMPEGTRLPEAGAVTDVDFLQGVSGDAYIDLLEDPAKFNKLLNTVASTAYIAAMNASQESIMRKIPDIVANSTNQQVYVNNATAEFYKNNPDLTMYKPAIAMAAMQIYNEQPNVSLPDLLTEAGKRTRDMLKLRPSSQRTRMPAQPAGRSIIGGVDRASNGVALTDQERQILDLLKD